MPENQDTTLLCTGLSRKYSGREVLRIGHLKIAPGERMAIVGRNGAGKTTWLRILLDLVRPTSGAVTLGNLSPRRARLQQLVSGYLRVGNSTSNLTISAS